MPVYDYVCAVCGQQTEVIHGIDAPGPRFCPACGAEGRLRKTLTAAAVHFKGSGWAKKDRSASRSKVKSTEGSDGAAPSTETAAKGTSDGSSPSSADGDAAAVKKAPPAADSNKGAAGSAQAEG